MNDFEVYRDLKLMHGEKQIGHTEGTGNAVRLVLDPGILPVDAPFDLFKGEVNEVNILDVINWVNDRVFPSTRIDREKILRRMDAQFYDAWRIARWHGKASIMEDDYWLKFMEQDDYYKDTIRGRAKQMRKEYFDAVECGEVIHQPLDWEA